MGKGKKKREMTVRELPAAVKIIENSGGKKDDESMLEKEVVEAEKEQTQQFFVTEGFVPTLSAGAAPQQMPDDSVVRGVAREKTVLQEQREETARVEYGTGGTRAVPRSVYRVSEASINPSLVQEREIFRASSQNQPFRGMAMESAQVEKNYSEQLSADLPEKPKRRYPWEV